MINKFLDFNKNDKYKICKCNKGKVTLSSEDMKTIEEVRAVQQELLDAHDNYEYVLDDELIDYYIYEVKALEKRYEYLLKKAKNIC